MPLIKSKSKGAFKKNVATEVKAGKPVKQAVAIAYSTKRAAKKAGGGSIDPRNYDSDEDYKQALHYQKYPKYSTDWTREDEHASRAVQRKYDRKYAGMSAAEEIQHLLKKDDERNKRLGLGKYKTTPKCGGGKVKSGW
jgi:hypothetical protein